MEGASYILCALTALGCGLLLLRGFWRGGTRLLLWCGIFFLAMVVENIVLFVDLLVVPDTDLLVFRRVLALVGTMVLLYGLIWETR